MEGKNIMLPPPVRDGRMSVERAMSGRRSCRAYESGSLSSVELSQLLWAAQGTTGDDGKRTAPSAGALYPLEIYVVAGDVRGIPSGVYRFEPETHELAPVADGDIRKELSEAALGQEAIENAAASIVICAVFSRTREKYGRRADKYVYVEVGHAAQNVYLQAVPLGLGTVMIGAFDANEVRWLSEMRRDERPVAIMPVGRCL